MPTPPEPPASTDDLQFATPEPIATGTPVISSPVQTCLVCHRPITSKYFALRDKVLCPACCELVKAPPPGTRTGRFTKAGLMGLGAGLIGALIWFIIRRVAHVEIGLVAVLVGFMVGKAVRKGSGNRGGRGYQVLAVILTYSCIAANYMPDVIEAVLRQSHTHQLASTTAPSGSLSTTTAPSTVIAPKPHRKIGVAGHIGLLALLVVLIFVASLIAPFLGGTQNLIGLLIIGFALWEAWKFNKAAVLAITGPYQIGSRTPTSGARA